MGFLTLPVSAWVVCGMIKFGVNFVRHGREAFERIGHGGFPSNHAAIISSIMWALIFIGDWNMAGLALAVLMICIFDATGLRRQIGYHAAAINELTACRLREIVGHNPIEIAAGLVVGLTVAIVYWFVGAIS